MISNCVIMYYIDIIEILSINVNGITCDSNLGILITIFDVKYIDMQSILFKNSTQYMIISMNSIQNDYVIHKIINHLTNTI